MNVRAQILERSKYGNIQDAFDFLLEDTHNKKINWSKEAPILQNRLEGSGGWGNAAPQIRNAEEPKRHDKLVLNLAKTIARSDREPGADRKLRSSMPSLSKSSFGAFIDA